MTFVLLNKNVDLILDSDDMRSCANFYLCFSF